MQAFLLYDAKTGAIAATVRLSDPKTTTPASLKPGAGQALLAVADGPYGNATHVVDVTKAPPVVAARATRLPPSAAYQAHATYQSLLAAGIAVTSKSAPALDGTYAIDDASYRELEVLALSAATSIGLPSGFKGYPDHTGALKPHTAQSLAALYAVLREQRSALRTARAAGVAGAATTWPAMSATIL